MFSIMLTRLANSRPKSIEADVVFELIQMWFDATEEDIELDKHEISKLWANSKEDGGSCLWNWRSFIPWVHLSVTAKSGYLGSSCIALLVGGKRELKGLAEIYQEILQVRESLESVIIGREGPSVFGGL